MGHELTSNDALTQKITAHGINTFPQLLEYTQNLPYGRNANRQERSLVWTEQKGTCSSKHAFLKEVADFNGILGVKLILAIYKMNPKNTPGIGGDALSNVSAGSTIDFIPEAHCYLKIDGVRMDLTSKKSNFDRIKNDILEEIEIKPEQVEDFKVAYHKQFIKKWLTETQLPLEFEQVWEIREKCIANLS